MTASQNKLNLEKAHTTKPQKNLYHHQVNNSLKYLDILYKSEGISFNTS